MGEFFVILTLVIVSMFGGFLLGVVEAEKPYTEKREQCQKDLPRTQHCTIIAVPEQELEDY